MSEAVATPQEAKQEARPKPVEFLTELIGTLNGEEIHLTGTGTIDEVGGVNEGVFEIARLPLDVDGRSLGAFLLTGYPNSCRIRQNGISNPFVGGSYKYQRRYDFESGEAAILTVTCDRDKKENTLTSRFELSGTVPALKGVGSVSPIYELWSPEDGQLKGSFGVAWLDEKTGSVLQTATALSDYQPVDVSRLGNKPKRRYLKLDSHFSSDGRLFVRQTSELVSA
jgi:hypothetical protein